MVAESAADAPRLLSMAVALADEGQYNVAKLLRAAAASQGRRAGHQVASTRLPAEQADTLESIAEAIGATPAAALAEPLRAAATVLRAGGICTFDETPDPMVCRLCGRVETSRPEGRCPDCGAWGSTFERFRGVYWLSESSPAESLQRLAGAPEVIAAIMGDLDEGALRHPAPGGGWSVAQVLDHLSNAQALLADRVGQFLAADDPVLTAMQVWAQTSEVSRTTAQIFAGYRDSRAAVLKRLEALVMDDWWRTGRHPEWGRLTLIEQVSYFANHEPTHFAQMADAAEGVRQH